jgi:LPXTG-motif cell wall-anchored protein
MHFLASRMRVVLALVAVVLGMSLFGASSVSAHEERVVATDYTFVVGFINEPAISGDTNGISLEVTKAGAPVEGLGDTLKAKVIFGDQSKDMTLSPVWNTPGAYEAVFIPTAPGDYTFQFTGTIETVTVDETFTSSPEGFDSVADRADFEFPVDANGSTSDSTVAMPFLVGAVILIAGGLFFVRRRAVAQPGQ